VKRGLSHRDQSYRHRRPEKTIARSDPKEIRTSRSPPHGILQGKNINPASVYASQQEGQDIFGVFVILPELSIKNPFFRQALVY
jgi:hypothetical protein